MSSKWPSSSRCRESGVRKQNARMRPDDISHPSILFCILHPASCDKKVSNSDNAPKTKIVRQRYSCPCRTRLPFLVLILKQTIFGSHRHSAGSRDMDTWEVTRHASASDGSMNHRVRVVRSWHRTHISYSVTRPLSSGLVYQIEDVGACLPTCSLVSILSLAL